jgi:periplasmic protein TonB
MKKEQKYFESLDELAFEGRNKAYGSYLLRRKYLKYVISSLILSVIIFLLIIFVPFILYYFEGSNLNFKDEDMYMVDYTFMPTPEEDLNALAKSLARPVVEENQPPVVVDSAEVVEEKKTEEVPPQEENQEEDQKTDSVSNGKGSSGQGQGTGDPSGLYTILDVFPRFPGGDEARLYFLRNNIRYPEIALKMGVQGVVMMVFIIEQDGLISHVEVKKGIGGGCDEEALRVTRLMPRWDPGKRSGRPVRVMVQMPLVFKIPGRLPK